MTLDVGLADGIGDGDYLALLRRHLDDILARFVPDVVFYLAGVDPVRGDRYGRLALSDEGLRQRERGVLDACVSRGLPVVITIAGGYAPTPERTAAAIQSFNEPLVLLLGGRDKNLPWDDLAELIHQRVDHVILFGEAAGLIQKAIGPVELGRRPYSLEICGTLQEAVQAAAQVSQPGDIVLLSPGGTSYDQFKDFEERGESFRRWVNQLP